jgi:hypothetical protein
MSQQCYVVQADPWTLATELAAISTGIKIVEKTSSSGKFIVVADSLFSGQNYQVISGDPDALAAAINTIILGGFTIDFVTDTFSASHYVVGYR